jgi:hypothetical protein
MRYIFVFVLGALLTATFSASAQEAYIAGGVGRSNWNMNCGPSGCNRTTTAFRVAAGYRFNRVVALEAFHFDFGRARSSDPSINGELGGTAQGAEAIVGWQFGDVEFAGKIGLASVHADYRPAPSSFYPAEHRTHTEPIAGAMLAYRFTPHLALRLDFDIVTVGLDTDRLFYYGRAADVSTVLLGVAYRF